jgi:hypothetical protein
MIIPVGRCGGRMWPGRWPGGVDLASTNKPHVRRRNRSASIWQWMCSVDREPAISYGIPPCRLVPTYAAAGWERTSALRKTLFPCSIECGIKPCDPTVAGSTRPGPVRGQGGAPQIPARRRRHAHSPPGVPPDAWLAWFATPLARRPRHSCPRTVAVPFPTKRTAPTDIHPPPQAPDRRTQLSCPNAR